MMKRGKRNSVVGAWLITIIGGALAAFLASYLLFLFPPTRVFGGDDSKGTESEETAAMGQEQLAPDLAGFRVFIQYYPSTAGVAANIRRVLETTGSKVEHFRELREGQLDPRMSEIIFYSDKSRAASEKLKALLADDDVDHQFTLARSPYYGDSGSERKIFVNVF
jgi:hypothetical protein